MLDTFLKVLIQCPVNYIYWFLAVSSLVAPADFCFLVIPNYIFLIATEFKIDLNILSETCYI